MVSRLISRGIGPLKYQLDQRQDPMDKMSEAIYYYLCGELTCDEEYIRETSRTFGERFKEHLKEPSPIHMHNSQTGHSTTSDNLNIIERDDHGLARTIKESIFIMVNNPTLNRNVGKFNLHHLWERVLSNTPDLKINNDNGHAHKTSLSGHVQSIPTNRHSHRTIGYTGDALNSCPT